MHDHGEANAKGEFVLRLILGVVIGLIVGAAAVTATEALDYRMFPPPLGLNADDPATVRAALAAIPDAAHALMLAGWLVATAIGAGAAGFVARRLLAVEVVAVAALAFALLYLSMSPHPWWMWAGAILLLPLAGWTTGRFGIKKASA